MKSRNGDTENTASEQLQLQLFVSGMSPKSMDAIENIRRICSKYLDNNYRLDIIDIYKNPAMAQEQQIVFCPSLVKTYPLPKKILVGSLEDTQKVLQALGVKTTE